MKVDYTSKYLRMLRKLPHLMRRQIEEREAVFRDNPFDARLDTHKLHGKETPHWSFSIDKKIRIKFLPIDSGNALFVEVGPHDKVYK